MSYVWTPARLDRLPALGEFEHSIPQGASKKWQRQIVEHPPFHGLKPREMARQAKPAVSAWIFAPCTHPSPTFSVLDRVISGPRSTQFLQGLLHLGPARP